MSTVHRLLLCTALWAWGGGALAQSAAQPLYRAQFVDGSRKAADTIGPWTETTASPTIDGAALFDPGRPVRWLLNGGAKPGPSPRAFVEFVGGDCLPGRVTAYQSAREQIRDRLPPHLEVAPYLTVDCPDMRSRPVLRVRIEWLRRIVWKPAAAVYRPQTVFLEDGRQLDFRSARFGEGEISLLRDEGITRVPLGEVAELHFAAADPWDAWYGQLAALSPDSTGRIVEVATVDGLRARASMERFQARAVGDASKPENWWHAIQPAWSLDPIWLDHPRIRMRRWFAPHEVPLTRIEPAAIRQQPELAGAWQPAIDLNLEGELLESGGQEYLWGFGVHGACELEFPLPPAALTLRLKLGLDRMAGEGGCVRAAVLAGAARRSLYASDFLVGSSQVLDPGPLALGDSPPTLVLRVDAAHDGRPAGADPLDIRDTLDWLEPLVELDPDQVKREAARRTAKLMPAWEGWQVSTGDEPTARLANQWIENRRQEGAFRLLAVGESARPLRLTAKLAIRGERDRLMLAVSRPSESSPSRIEVLIDGEPVESFEVPIREREKLPKPKFVSLAGRPARDLAVEIRQTGPDAKAAVDWHSLAMVGADEEKNE